MGRTASHSCLQRLTCPAIDDRDGSALGRQPARSPRGQRREHDREFARLDGWLVLVTRRTQLIPALFQEAVDYQRIQPLRQDVWCDAQIDFEFVKAPKAQDRIAHDEHPPRIANLAEAASNRTFHLGKGRGAHGVKTNLVTCNLQVTRQHGECGDFIAATDYVCCVANPSPYRALSSARRVALLTHLLTAHRETRSVYIQRLVSRGGGFRAVTMQPWPAERIAKEVVRLNAESAQDEIELLQLLYVDLEPGIQITFADAAGVQHDGGKIEEALEPPYAEAAAVARAADAVREQHGGDGVHYLRTIARYNLGAWPGLDVYLAALDTPEGK